MKSCGSKLEHGTFWNYKLSSEVSCLSRCTLDSLTPVLNSGTVHSLLKYFSVFLGSVGENLMSNA